MVTDRTGLHSKSDELKGWGRFEITPSTIPPWILKHEVQLLITESYVQQISGLKMLLENFFWA